MDPLPRYRFERLVRAAIDRLPDDLRPVLDNVAVRIVDRDDNQPNLLGLYDGVPHVERDGTSGPDVITVYRHAHCDLADNERELAEQVTITVLHEIAHAAGIDDDRLEELGWG